MESSFDCNRSPACAVPPRSRPLPSLGAADWIYLAVLTLGVLLAHGYHPWAEDGGLYVAGVEYKLNSFLFPRQTAFVTAHLRYSIFAPFVAALVRLSRLSLATVLFSIYLLSIALMLYAGLQLAARCFNTRPARWTATALLAAWWTLPVAGTSLLLMDPYVTARSLSTPLSLLAVAAALDPWPMFSSRLHRGQAVRRFSPPWLCGFCLLAAAAFHPLMAVYALGLVAAVRLSQRRTKLWLWLMLGLGAFSIAALIQGLARPETPPVAAAAYSRYYWFLSQWQWFEWLGLLGPVVIFTSLLRGRPSPADANKRVLCRAALVNAFFAFVIALSFAQEHFAAHAVARLQPLRAFLLLYAVMILLLGGTLAEAAVHFAARPHTPAVRSFGIFVRAAPAVFVAAMAIVMFSVQRASFPSSIHLELSGRVNPNPWVRAFLWARDHTAPDALFALDARYVNTGGEDAQTFRAIAERSAVPDFSKDGGEAAITPALALPWQVSALATRQLSKQTDTEREASLHSLGVDWVVLDANAHTAQLCPYRNAVVKICHL